MTTPSVPSSDAAWELAGWDATATRERIARGEVSAAEVVEAALVRARDTAALNALVTACEGEARAAARGAPRGALFGVPTAIKDLAQVRGVRTAWGSASVGHHVSTRSDPTVKRLEATGMVSIGKSATPEFGLTGTTEPLAFGPARNPWAPERSAGGSSGGAAVLVAAGVVPVAHGSDGGGSIRIPASCCGLVGLKPSRRRLDMEGSSALPVNIAVHGVLSRTVRDTVAFWSAIETVRPALALPPIGAPGPQPSRRLRLGLFVDSPLGYPVDPEVKGAAEAAGALCRSLGHEVELIRCPFAAEVLHDFVQLWAFTAFAQVRMGRWLLHRGFDAARVEPLTLGFGRQFTAHVGRSLAAMVRLRRFAAVFHTVLERYDALISPTLGELPPRLGHLGSDVPFETALDRLLHFTPFTGVLNIAGAPGISLPLGRSRDGVPIGVQFAAAHGAERLLLELAAELERAQPWPEHTARPVPAAP